MEDYIIVGNEKVPVTREQRLAWMQTVNRCRRYAREHGACSQPDYRKCRGDCCVCPYQTQGRLVSVDQGGFDGSPIDIPNRVSAEDEYVSRDTWAWLYEQADMAVERGREILRLYLEDGLSAHGISRETGIPKSTVVDRLNKLIRFMREHADEII